MSDSLDSVSFDYDVFIIHAGCDLKTAQTICKYLESHDQKLRCLKPWTPTAYPAGRPVIESIVENMSKSQTTLLILTEESFSTSWVSLETILALEYSVIRKHLTLRLLLCDVKETETEFLKRGLLENVPDICVSFNKDSWLDDLVSSIRMRIPIPEILPAGCLAHGQVFSHFIGYLVYLLPELEKRIEEMEIYKKNPNCFSKKLCMLIPGSCKLPNTLDQLESDSGTIVRTVSSHTFKARHAGKERDLKLMVNSVTKGDKVYYFIADLPNVLNAIYKIATDGLARIDIPFQIARFYYTMNEVLNHSENLDCAEKVLLVPFNDETEQTADVIFQAIHEDVMCQRTQQCMSVSTRTPQRFLSRQTSYPEDVLICVSDDPEDLKRANEIQQFLTRNKKTVALQRRHFSDLTVGRWVIFIISKASLSPKDGLLLKCLAVLVDSIHNDMLRTLPVLVDVEPKDLPQIIKWVTLVSVKEANYEDRLLQTINGGVIRVQDRLPSGDVATGLVWAYVLNYLTLTLLTKTDEGLDFCERIQKLLSSKQLSCGCIPKLFLLVPRSCQAKKDLAMEANDSCPSPQVEFVGSLDPVVADTGGIHKRTYRLTMYKYTDKNVGRSVCFVCEYSTPINCMYEMANSFPFAGLHKEDMYRQGDAFVQMFPSIVSRETVKKKLGDVSNMVQLIRYDDETEPLLTALKREMKLENVNQSDLVYSTRSDMMELD